MVLPTTGARPEEHFHEPFGAHRYGGARDCSWFSTNYHNVCAKRLEQTDNFDGDASGSDVDRVKPCQRHSFGACGPGGRSRMLGEGQKQGQTSMRGRVLQPAGVGALGARLGYFSTGRRLHGRHLVFDPGGRKLHSLQLRMVRQDLDQFMDGHTFGDHQAARRAVQADHCITRMVCGLSQMQLASVG